MRRKRRFRLLDSGHGGAFNETSLQKASVARAVFRTGVREQRHLEIESSGAPRNYEPCRVEPPKMDGSRWRFRSPLEREWQTTSVSLF